MNKIVIGTDAYVGPMAQSPNDWNIWRDKRLKQHRLLKQLMDVRKQLSAIKVKPYYALKVEVSIKGSKNLDIDQPGTKVRYSVVITLLDHKSHSKRKIFTYDAKERHLVALGKKPIKGIIDNYDSVIKSIQRIVDERSPS